MMETIQPKLYKFWDGDFEFHRVIYEDSEFDYTFRVRIDNESPETRALANEHNPNAAQPNWKAVRPAIELEIELWLSYFQRGYPQRPEIATAALRHLSINGPLADGHPSITSEIEDGIILLVQPRTVVRNFNPTTMCFVELRNGQFRLTDEGRWLTGLMK